jgi:hypothetical protein
MKELISKSLYQRAYIGGLISKSYDDKCAGSISAISVAGAAGELVPEFHVLFKGFAHKI